MAKQRDKSALYHINQCTPKSDTIQVHFLQARNGLAKKDEEGRAMVSSLHESYERYCKDAETVAEFFRYRIDTAGEDDE